MPKKKRLIQNRLRARTVKNKMQEELENLRQKRLEEIQRQFSQQKTQEEQIKTELAQLDTLIKQRMTKEAISRYGNIKISHPDVAITLLGILVQLFEKNPERTIDDKELKKLLILINSSKKTKYSLKK